MLANKATKAPVLEIDLSRQFTSWLAEQNLSIAFTTYQIGKLCLIGLNASRELSVSERSFNRCMGLCATPNGFYMSSLYQIWQFENMLESDQRQSGYDRLYVPQLGYTTGDLDVHDMAVDRQGSLIFVNTLFSCLATLSKTHSFKPIWKPTFISKLAAEDRCHLNGLAMQHGLPAYVTAIGRSDVVDGWRDHRVDGGIVIDVRSDQIICDGLSMPHSPRWYQEKLWLLNSGTGEFGFVDPKVGRFESLCFCPGYARGLSFHGHYALIGLSKPRTDKTFRDLPLESQFEKRKIEPRCGILIVDLRSGDIAHWLRMDGIVTELYDVITLPNVNQPMALGFKTDEIRRMINIEH